MAFISSHVALAQGQHRWHTPRCALGRRALGVDYGLSRVGLAVSVGIAPRLLPLLHERDAEIVAQRVARAAHEYMADDIVLGLPLNSEGKVGDQAKRTMTFARLLTVAAPRHRLYLLDERFTTAQANEMLIGNANAALLRDSIAAANILARYFTQQGEVRPELFYEPQAQVCNETKVQCDDEKMSFMEWKKAKMREAKQLAAEIADEKKRRKQT